ncbi:hypothetical protein TGRH88_080170 [Toxoplasma gondii]|uniref:Uncharacterized protein n=1 Tax=Toxoplasma gondii TaxID=5811 RepID=A0A7J6K5J7_TOXGO|nr:hypothetical protein TGRH88_080170 [Toxoplasma gondii]
MYVFCQGVPGCRDQARKDLRASGFHSCPTEALRQAVQRRTVSTGYSNIAAGIEHITAHRGVSSSNMSV